MPRRRRRREFRQVGGDYCVSFADQRMNNRIQARFKIEQNEGDLTMTLWLDQQKIPTLCLGPVTTEINKAKSPTAFWPFEVPTLANEDDEMVMVGVKFAEGKAVNKGTLTLGTWPAIQITAEKQSANE